jgi:translation initiation factor IF-3
LNFKLNNARKFLMEGDKVKVTVMFRGREMVHTYRGREQLKSVLEQLGPLAKLESSPRMEGRFMSMILVADREVVAEAKREAEQEAAGQKSDPEEAANEAADASASASANANETKTKTETETETEAAEQAASEVQSEPSDATEEVAPSS